MLRSDSSLSANDIATMLATVTNLVNTERSTLVAASKKLPGDLMTQGFATYADRINWIKRYRGFDSNRALARAANLSYATVNNLLKRERDEGAAALDLRSSLAIATAAKVNHHWLVTGEGYPDDTAEDAASAPKLATEARRRAAKELSRLDGVDEKEAAFIIQGIDVPNEDVTDAFAYYAAARHKLGAPASIPRETLLLEQRNVSAAQPRTLVRSRKR